jgi:hypothetical protein
MTKSCLERMLGGYYHKCRACNRCFRSHHVVCGMGCTLFTVGHYLKNSHL